MDLISVCICTYKRPGLLGRLLKSLADQEGTDGFEMEIIIVDNDRDASARYAVQEFTDQYRSMNVRYDVVEQKSISLARDRSVSLAEGDFIAFLDDDEFAHADWLNAMYKTLKITGADAVFGPVIPEYPDHCPPWIVKGKFFDRPQEEDCKRIYCGRTGNALVRASWLRMDDMPFDPRFGFTGGEDSDFFARMRKRGAVFFWSQYGKVYENVEEDRLTLSWLLMRAFRGGQGFAERALENTGFSRKIFHYSYRLILCCVAMLMALFFLPVRFHNGVWWLRKVFSNAGQLSVILPYRFQAYR